MTTARRGMNPVKRLCLLMGSMIFISACNTESEEVSVVAPSTTVTTELLADSDTQCSNDSGITYICGVINAEDLLLLGDSGMILVSGMSDDNLPGSLYLVNSTDDSFIEFISDGNFIQKLDSDTYPNCPGPLSLGNYSVHGLALDEYASQQFSLYFTSHGEREAIEVFDLDMRNVQPQLTWHGCVVMPANTFSNSVAILADGGFVTTKMMDPSVGFAAVAAGEITGNVYEWHPGGSVFAIPGTELSGANGIAMSADERYMFVAALGSHEVARYDRSMSPMEKVTVQLSIAPDNMRWVDDGTLLTAGENYLPPEECPEPGCATGWSVVMLDVESMTAKIVGGADGNAAIQGVSSALIIGDEYWVGTYSGDRIGHFPR